MERLAPEIHADCVVRLELSDTFFMSFDVKMCEKIDPIDYPWIGSSDAFRMKIKDLKVLLLCVVIESMECRCLV
jgi:hypothetical protein